MREIAALFVGDKPGDPYMDLPGVDAWGITRDARTYAGPHPVVAHPPCERWGRYAKGGPNVKVPFEIGDDAGCFESALESVRRFGGILEHPEGSHAWARFGLERPTRTSGWIRADDHGFTCSVAQGHYGHPAQKMTWLYAVRVDLPDLVWGPAPGLLRMDDGFRSTEQRRELRAAGVPPKKHLKARERWATPVPFRDLLIAVARTVR